jgi:hypothetical protein
LARLIWLSCALISERDGRLAIERLAIQSLWSISWFAMRSRARIRAEWSHLAPPRAAQALNNCCVAAVFGRDRPICLALDVGRVRNHGDDDIRLLGRLLGMGAGSSAGAREIGRHSRSAGQEHLAPIFDKLSSHGPAHDAKTDEPDLHPCVSIRFRVSPAPHAASSNDRLSARSIRLSERLSENAHRVDGPAAGKIGNLMPAGGPVRDD